MEENVVSERESALDQLIIQVDGILKQVREDYKKVMGAINSGDYSNAYELMGGLNDDLRNNYQDICSCFDNGQEIINNSDLLLQRLEKGHPPAIRHAANRFIGSLCIRRVRSP